ncbi:MAG TPA: PAS domain S-box protein [Pirellulaceae bacterium]|jgi:PAS domain S-box-containing protein|nr:PAS domain S-box protein [Pirellulaceae bacterium]
MDETSGSAPAKQNELFRLLVENVLDYAIFVIDSDGRVQTWSDGAARLLGYSEEEILGELVDALFTPEDVQNGVPAVERRQALATGRGEDDRWHVKKDGSRFWAGGVMTPLWDDSGTLRGFAKIMRDRTEWKLADEARLESEARRAAVLETSLDGIVTIDHEDRIVEFNPAAERIFGYRREEVLGHRMADLIVPARLRPDHYRGMARFLATGEGPALGKRLKLPALRADGTEFPAELAIVRVPKEGPPHFTGYIRDITERAAEERWREVQLDVTQALAEAPTVGVAAPRVLQAICRNLGWDVGGFWIRDAESQRLVCLDMWSASVDRVASFRDASRPLALARGQGLPGRVWQSGTPLCINDVSLDRNFPRLAVAAAVGLRGALAVPVLLGSETVGVIELFRRAPLTPDDDLLARLAALGGHVGQFIGRKANEERLRESEARLRTLINNLPRGALYQVVHDAQSGQNRFTYLSAGVESLFGVTPAEAVADAAAVYGLIHKDDVERVLAAEAEALRMFSQFDCEFRHRKSTGEVGWVHCRSAPRAHTDGEVFWEGIMLDATDRKRAEELLQQQSRITRSITDNATTAVFLLNADGQLTFMNPAAEEMTGFRFEEAQGKILHDLIHHTRPDGSRYPVEECALSSRVFGRSPLRDHEDLYYRKDGSSFPVRCAASPLLEEGELTGIVLEVVDVTEAKRSEEARRESDERFRAIADRSVTGIAETDVDGRFVFANDRFCEMLGRSREELLSGLRMQDVTHLEDLSQNVRLLQQSFRDDAPFVIEKRYLRPDGEVVWVNNSISVVRDVDGQPVRVVAVSVDVTARKRAEDDLREANLRKDEFLAMLAHELRNPLAPIRSGLDLLAMTGVESEIIEAMQQQVSHLVRLVDDLLDASRIMRGRVELRKRPVGLAAILKQAAATVRPLIDAHDQTLTLSLPSEDVRLYADPVRLTQVISNLLHNASKYNERGGEIFLSASVESDEVAVTVRDTGVGIEPELLPKVFDLFTQSSRSIDRSQGGLGIGLTVVKSLVEMHGGVVSARSDGPGEGSEFTVRLPIHPGPHEEESIERVERETPRNRILVVDDNVAAAKMLSRLLTKLGGHEVFLAHDGPGALAAASACRPDIILLDIGLPGMDGYEVARQLRALPEFERTLVVALTGYGTEADRSRSLHAGCDDHIVKPPGIDALRSLFAHPKLPAG